MINCRFRYLRVFLIIMCIFFSFMTFRMKQNDNLKGNSTNCTNYRCLNILGSLNAYVGGKKGSSKSSVAAEEAACQ